jgi:prevent-host-death family protein
MDEIVSAADANRSFSSLLRGVQQGHTYVVTNHGKPVARIVPVTEDEEEAIRERARAAHLERLRSQPAIDIGPWTRDELYEDEP